MAILTFPFLYNEHGTPSDCRRFTAYQVDKPFPDCKVLYLEKQGGIGSHSHPLPELGREEHEPLSTYANTEGCFTAGMAWVVINFECPRVAN